MANDNQQPLLVAGKLPKECYKTLQEFVEDLPKVLLFPLDAVEVIKGAQGIEGPRGPKGQQGSEGQGITLIENIRLIAAGVSFVEFPFFGEWKNANYQITSIAKFATTVEEVPDFIPANGIVGVGTVLEVYSVTAPTRLRCYFVFHGGISVTPNANFRLQISYYK